MTNIGKEHRQLDVSRKYAWRNESLNGWLLRMPCFNAIAEAMSSPSFSGNDFDYQFFPWNKGFTLTCGSPNRTAKMAP